MLVGEVIMGEKVFEIEKPVAKILLIAQIESGAFAEYKQNGGVDTAVQQLFTDWGNGADGCLISAEYVRSNGNRERICNSMPVITLAEFSQHLEGAMYVDSSGYVYMTIDLSQSGAIPFMSDETLRLTVVNNGSLFEGVTIHTLESPLQAEDRVEYNTLSVGTLKEKSFDLTQTDKLMIPLSQILATTELHFKYSNGRTCKFKKDELIALAVATNDNVLNIDGRVVGGFGRYVILDASTITGLDVVRGSSGELDFIAVHSEVLDTAQQADNVNSKLVDVSAEYAVRKAANLQMRA